MVAARMPGSLARRKARKTSDNRTAPPQEIFGFRRSALLEMAIFFGLVLVIDMVFGNGDRFVHANPHPFWIAVILIPVQYGIKEGLLAAFLASIILLAWNIPPQLVSEMPYEYYFRIIYRPVLWLISALVIGQLSSRHIRAFHTLQEEVAKIKDHEDTISRAYEDVKDIKNTLETRLASQLQSAAFAYHSIRSIDISSEETVLQGADSIIKEVMDPKAFSVYVTKKKGFELFSSRGWSKKDEFSQSYAKNSNIYKEIMKRRDVICVVNRNDAKLLKGEGVLAAPLMDPVTDHIFGMVKIEKMGFDHLTLSNIETFEALCECIGHAYADAEKYHKVRDNSMVDFEDGLLSYTFFTHISDFLSQLRQKHKIPVTYLDIRIKNANEFTKEQRVEFIRIFCDSIRKSLPDIAQLFDGKDVSSEFLVLLPSHDQKKATAVTNKLKETIKKTRSPNLRGVIFSYDIQEIK